jgi:hypothetical protein
MGDLVQLVLDALQYAWPFREVEGWQRGVYTVLGSAWREVGPGRWPVIPYFMDVRAISVVSGVVRTPLQFVTLSNGEVASFSASATVQVEDARAAIFEVDDYSETTQELISAVLSQELAEVDPERFGTARRRKNLLDELGHRLDVQTVTFGVRVTALRFNNFAIGIRLFRLVQDSATLQDRSW